MNRTILEGDALDKLQEIPDNEIDLIATDPPYGYSFMNKNWDKAVISVDIWKECLRVMKPGAFAFVMSAPRQDVLSHMIVNLSDAGFKTDFTSIYWAYATGFPKAANISKLVDKKLGVEPIKTTPKDYTSPDFSEEQFTSQGSMMQTHTTSGRTQVYNTKPNSEQAKKLDGSYAGFQPKPAVEVILVCMKPLSEKNYVEQAMKDGKGVTWFDDCRIPTNDVISPADPPEMAGLGSVIKGHEYTPNNSGRFPANLLVSDNVLNGESRYFDLDSWEAQFIITPKPSKSEKNKGLDSFIEEKVNDGRKIDADNPFQRGKSERKNTHPTVKPVSLFKYLITMGSRENDLVLDPFMGSGTTAIACEQTARQWIGIEKLPEHIEIFKARLDNYKKQHKLEAFLS